REHVLVRVRIRLQILPPGSYESAPRAEWHRRIGGRIECRVERDQAVASNVNRRIARTTELDDERSGDGFRQLVRKLQVRSGNVPVAKSSRGKVVLAQGLDVDCIVARERDSRCGAVDVQLG